MHETEKAQVKLAIRDRIDELKLSMDREDPGETQDDEEAKLHQLASSGIETALLAANRRELESLRRSLAWLESDEGGFCEGCGCEINGDRLLAVPSTRTCIECARKREI